MGSCDALGCFEGADHNAWRAGHEYVSISDKGVRTKVGIDASLPFGFTGRYERVPVPPADLSKYTTTLEPGGI